MVDRSIDGRSLQVDLVCIDPAVPVAGCVGSRNSCASAPAQRTAAQTSETSGLQQHRAHVACRALSPGSRGRGRFENYEAGDANSLAPRWIPSLLALEIPTARWPAEDSGGYSPPHSRDGVANPLWGAPRIHGELLKLGIDVGQTTVAKYMARRRRLPSQGWKTFLHNHADGIASMDMFLVPTISFRLLYGFLILRHSRRELLWLGVTAHPSAEWVARQITEAYGWEQAPRYIIRDRDCVYGHSFSPSPSDGHSRSADHTCILKSRRQSTCLRSG